MTTATARVSMRNLVRGTATLVLIAGTAASFVGASGCSSAPAEAKRQMVEPMPLAKAPPAQWDSRSRPVSEPLTYPMPAREDGPTLLSRQRLSVPATQEGIASSGLIQSQPGELMHVQYKANKQDVTEVIQALVGGLLERDYVLDASIQGIITLDIDEEMTRADLVDLVEGLGTIFGWSLEQRGGTLFIKPGVKSPRASTSPILLARPAVDSETPAVRVRRLRHLSGDQVVGVLKEFMSETAKAVTVGRTVIMADTVRQISRLSDLLSALDAPAFEGVEIWTYRLAHRKPEDAAQLLQNIAASSSINSGPDPTAAFIPLTGTQRLMVIAKDATILPLVGDLIRQVDTPADREPRHRYSYNIQHYQPVALVKLLRDFFGDRVEQTPSEGGDPRIRIASDPAGDMLLIYATPSDYSELLATLRTVDRAPQQVQIQSIIAEVSLTNRLAYGVEYFLEINNSLGELALTGSAPLVGAATGSALFVGSDGFAVIQALDRESDTQILSQPKIFLQDRTTGSIQVGGEVPVVRATEGSSTQQAGTTGIREEIEYRKTGVILTIKAEINELGLVRMEITQEVTDVIPTSVANQPEFTTRIIETTVVVPHGQTVLLGGIITNDKRNTTNRIPLIGRVPLLGEAFKNTDNFLRRTELLLTITPTIVNEPGAARMMTSDFMRAVYGVRSLMNQFVDDLPQGSMYQVEPEPGPMYGPVEEVDPEARSESATPAQQSPLPIQSTHEPADGSSSAAFGHFVSPITSPTAYSFDWAEAPDALAFSTMTVSWDALLFREKPSW